MASSRDRRCRRELRAGRPRSQRSNRATAATGNYELRILPDPNIYDGRFANNGWLQELPKPQTKICWENVALVSPKTAVAIGYDDKRRDALVNEKQTLLADVKYRGRTLRTPIWVVPGHADGTITMFMGYGRTRGGKIATPLPMRRDVRPRPRGVPHLRQHDGRRPHAVPLLRRAQRRSGRGDRADQRRAVRRSPARRSTRA